MGSKFFPFREEPFSEGDKTILKDVSPLKVYSFPLKHVILETATDDILFLFSSAFPRRKGLTFQVNSLPSSW